MAKTLEEIAKDLKKMKFKSALFGGVDKKDVWKKIERLNDDYMQYIEQQRIGYEAVIADKERMIANGITVNAAQVVAGPGAMAPGIPQGMDPAMMGMGPVDPNMMGMGPYGDPSSAPAGAPSPQGEGFYAGPAMLPPGMGPVDPAMLPPGMGPVDPAMLPPMLDENGNPLPMPPAMMGMPPMPQPSPWGEGGPLAVDEGLAQIPPGMPPFDPNMLPPGMDPAMMGMPPFIENQPPVGQMPPFDPNFAPPAGGFEPNWDPLPMPGEAPAPPQQPAIPPYNPSIPVTPDNSGDEV